MSSGERASEALVPSASAAQGTATPYHDDLAALPREKRPLCDAIVVSGARWQLLLFGGVFAATVAATTLVGPIAIAFGMTSFVPISVFAERRVVARLIYEGLSPQLAKRVARGGRVTHGEEEGPN